MNRQWEKVHNFHLTEPDFINENKKKFSVKVNP